MIHDPHGLEEMLVHISLITLLFTVVAVVLSAHLATFVFGVILVIQGIALMGVFK